MNQYIITEEQLLVMTSWATNKDVCLYEKRLSIANDVRSHPYQSERDIDEWCKVHSEVIKDIQTSAYREGYNDGKKSEQGKAMDKTRYNCKAYERMAERDYCEVIGGFLIPGTCPCSAWELRAGEP